MTGPRYREGQQIAIGTHGGQIARLRIWLFVVAVFAMVGMAGGAYGTWSAGKAAGKATTSSENTRRLATDNRALALRVAHDARVTTAALCALRNDLEVRVASSRSFLVDHPNGIPGISAKAIRDGIANQERTIVALSVIDC